MAAGERHPSTILLVLWMGATPRVFAKYVAEYIQLEPRSRILYVTTASADMFLRFSEQSHRRRLAPAIEAIRAGGGSVFLHIFSNGGVFTFEQIARGYREATGTAIPVQSMVIDSAPGTTD